MVLHMSLKQLFQMMKEKILLFWQDFAGRIRSWPKQIVNRIVVFDMNGQRNNHKAIKITV